MKRFFTNLKSLASKAMVVAMVGGAALAVSCSEAYDDTDLKQQVADLAERVADLEDRMNEEFEALRSLIDEKVAFAEVKEDGSWAFTLASGKTLTLYPEYVENGLTIVTENGVQYWAKVEGNVTTILTDAAGNKVQFVNAPDLRVNAEGIVEVSVDGGATWVATQAPSLFAAIEVEENVAYMTLQNGEVLPFVLYEQVNFNINGNALFVEPGFSEDVAMTLDGIVEIIPLSIPTGWSVEVDGLILTVTAPVEVEVEENNTGGGIMPWSVDAASETTGALGAADGTIKVLAVSKEGKVVVANLHVNAAVDGGQSLKVIGNTVKITNMKFSIETNWMGDEFPVVGTLLYTAFPTGEYTDIEALHEAIDYGEFKYEVAYITENGEFTFKVADLLKELCGVETIERGASYTFVAYDPEVWPFTEKDMMIAQYTSTYVSVTELSTSFKDIQVEIITEGYDGFKAILIDPTNEYSNPQEDFGYWQGGQFPNWGLDVTSSSFSGSLFELNSDNLEAWANKVYALYVLPLNALKATSDYTWDDVMGPFTYKTKNYTSGGMLVPTFAEYEATNYQVVNATIKPAAGAYRTHAHYFTAEQIASYPNDDDLIADIIKQGTASNGSDEVSVKADNLNPGSSVTVAAISVDESGKYGPVAKQVFSTKALTYSAATIEITDWNLTVSREMTSSTSSYVFGLKTTGDLTATYFKLETRSKYMTLEAQVNNAAVAVATNTIWGNVVPIENIPVNDAGLYAPAGRVKALPYSPGNSYQPSTTVGLSYGKEYLMTIVGVDAEGNPTQVAYKEFDTFVPMTICYSDDAKWAASKPTVTIGTVTTVKTYYEADKEMWDGYIEQGFSAEDLIAYGIFSKNPDDYTQATKDAAYMVDVEFTVTPAAGTKNLVVEYNHDAYRKEEVSVRVWLDEMIGETEAVPTDGRIFEHMTYLFNEATTMTATAITTNTDCHVYVTWQDEAGNQYEATADELVKGYIPEELDSNGGIAM